ncbi:hypothetical protein HOLleu_39913 [Holothuria leucospilota]|uniref:Uncharacterized protein n=1 Tax=Holothuria leucospilota TaxID=206669 RepID=A0A9Q1BD60_HOLLE|nr:hypothetical protein HOLleu_39913 [Holothuria leucospilota]
MRLYLHALIMAIRSSMVYQKFNSLDSNAFKIVLQHELLLYLRRLATSHLFLKNFTGFQSLTG